MSGLTERERERLAEAIVHGVRDRLKWASLHWGTEDVHPDAWPHLTAAAEEALVPVVAEMLDKARAKALWEAADECPGPAAHIRAWLRRRAKEAGRP